MAAPEYVPAKPMDDVRAYVSPPRRPAPWRADRPGDLDAGQPRGESFGSQGPDQGYALLLARRFHGKLRLEDDESEHDAIIGCVGVALKRASVLGRAPVIHDLTLALNAFGYLADAPPRDLVVLRKRLFAQVGHANHYPEQRRIVDLIPEATLRLTPVEVQQKAQTSWRDLLDPDCLAHVEGPDLAVR